MGLSSYCLSDVAIMFAMVFSVLKSVDSSVS
jgi:hypothetical protein